MTLEGEGHILLKERALPLDLVGIAFCDVQGSESRVERSFSTRVWTHLPLLLAFPHITTALPMVAPHAKPPLE